jgi:hypothetical protein
MHWEIEVIVRVEDVEIDYINEGLLLHHSITDIENPSSIWIKERKENGKIVEENLLNNQYNYRIEFKAIVFSTEEQESLRRYITRMNGVDSKKMLFKTLTGKEKASKAISVASISAIIVFIIIFSHEYIVSLAHNGHIELSHFSTIIAFSLAGAGATFFIDYLIVWKEKFGGLNFNK